MERDEAGQGDVTHPESVSPVTDSRLHYVAPTLDSVEGRMAALLGSQCPIDPGTGQAAN